MNYQSKEKDKIKEGGAAALLLLERKTASVKDAFIRRGSVNPERNEYGCKAFHTMHLHIDSVKYYTTEWVCAARKTLHRNKETTAVPADTVSTVKDTKS